MGVVCAGLLIIYYHLQELIAAAYRLVYTIAAVGAGVGVQAALTRADGYLIGPLSGMKDHVFALRLGAGALCILYLALLWMPNRRDRQRGRGRVE